MEGVAQAGDRRVGGGAVVHAAAVGLEVALVGLPDRFVGDLGEGGEGLEGFAVAQAGAR
ncbi:hypothetical protein GCM10009738_46060 [Kitasatospora viridis]